MSGATMIVAPPGEADSTWLWRSVVQHSLAWLAFGNVVGLLLAALLLFPPLGQGLTPLTYGRWVPVHYNSLLYGWTSLPLVGLLFRWYLSPTTRSGAASAALECWSGTLLIGCVSWLFGVTSGKHFMEWAGWPRLLLAATLLLLWLALAVGWIERLRGRRVASSPGAGGAAAAAQGIFLLILLAVPLVLYGAASNQVYPPINPDSGGATGGSLLISSLLVVTIIWFSPWAAGRRRLGCRGAAGITLLIQAAHYAWFFLLDHGDHSHHEPIQIISLGSLLIWVPLLAWHLRQFDWPPAARRWLRALWGWGAVLVVTGLAMFVPPNLDAWKFTNVLVAHSHAAMAGMLSSFCALALISLPGDAGSDAIWGGRRLFLAWQLGCALHVLALVGVGLAEAHDGHLVFQPDQAVRFYYFVRLAAGVVMCWVSLRWFGRALTAPRAVAPVLVHGLEARSA
jgi:cytochrome c oxidase cbb3-type subunit 1